MKDIFISYISTDQAWANWLTWVLADNDYSVDVEAFESSQGRNFAKIIQTGMQQ